MADADGVEAVRERSPRRLDGQATTPVAPAHEVAEPAALVGAEAVEADVAEGGLVAVLAERPAGAPRRHVGDLGASRVDGRRDAGVPPPHRFGVAPGGVEV